MKECRKTPIISYCTSLFQIWHKSHRRGLQGDRRRLRQICRGVLLHPTPVSKVRARVDFDEGPNREPIIGRESIIFSNDPVFIQGDHSGCVIGCVDIKTKVAFYNTDLIIKCNLCFDVNTTHDTTWMVTLYLKSKTLSTLFADWHRPRSVHEKRHLARPDHCWAHEFMRLWCLYPLHWFCQWIEGTWWLLIRDQLNLHLLLRISFLTSYLIPPSDVGVIFWGNTCWD